MAGVLLGTLVYLAEPAFCLLSMHWTWMERRSRGVLSISYLGMLTLDNVLQLLRVSYSADEAA